MDHFVSGGYRFTERRGWFGVDGRRRHTLLRVRHWIAHLPGERYERRVDAQHLVDLKNVATLFVSAQPRIIAVLAPPEIIPNLQVALRPATGSIERAP